MHHDSSLTSEDNQDILKFLFTKPFTSALFIITEAVEFRKWQGQAQKYKGLFISGGQNWN